MDDHPQAGIAGSQFLSPTGAIQSSPFRFMGILSELDQGLKLGVVSKTALTVGDFAAHAADGLPGGVALGSQHDPAAVDAGPDWIAR